VHNQCHVAMNICLSANPLWQHAVIVPVGPDGALPHLTACCFFNTSPAGCVVTNRLEESKLLHAVAQDVAGDAQEVGGPNLVVFGEV
jgi:hypothetical protein